MLYMADAYMGKAHVTADQIGDYNAGVSGSGCVLNVGEKLRAEIVNANLVRIYDGAFIFQGYRRSGITAGSYEDVTIENGTQAQKRNDLICAKYEKDAAISKENLTLAVIKGTPGDTASDPEIPEGDVRSGSAVCYMPLYRVKLDGINLTAVEKLFTVRKSLEEIEGDVAALNSQMSASCTISNSSAFTVSKSGIDLYKHAGIVEANITLYIVSAEANKTISVGTVPDGYRPIANINIPVVLTAGTSILGYGILLINTSGDVALRTNIAVSSGAPRIAISSTTYISA